MEALGMIEVYGYLSAVEALDSALKAANVNLHSVTKVKGGLVTVMVVGDVGAVKAAMDASAASAERIGKVISVHVIPRPDKDVFHMAQKGNKTETQQQIKIVDDKKIEEPENNEDNNEPEKAEEPVKTDIPKEPEEEIIEESHSAFSQEELGKKTVEELRHLARSLHVGNMTKNEIKFAKKGQLIEAICKFNEGGDK